MQSYIYPASCYRGAFDQRLQTLRRGAVAGRRRRRWGASFPLRRSKPRSVRRAVRTLGPPDGPVGRRACLSAHARPSGQGSPVERRGACNWRSERTGLPPRPTRSKPKKHRARDAMDLVDLRFKLLRQASMSRGVEARGSSRTRGVPRALGSFRRRQMDYGLPGAAKNTGDDACLIPPVSGEG
jgi:hypothetical protein